MTDDRRTTGVIITALVFILPVITQDQSAYFSGGFLSLHFIDVSNKSAYKAQMTVITGWTLGHGPCGPSCSPSDLGRSTSQSRLQAMQTHNNPYLFGSWSLEFQPKGSYQTIYTDVTRKISSEIQGNISSVSSKLHFEQEIATINFEIIPNTVYTDITMKGDYWRMFDLNPVAPGSHFLRDSLKPYSNQIKLPNPVIRNDTGKPNSTPMVLNRPMYRVPLSSVTQIRLTTSDQDEDYVACRLPHNVEIGGLLNIPGVTVTQNCVVRIEAFTSNNFSDDRFGMVAIAVEDFNRQVVNLNGTILKSYPPQALSTSLLDFIIWVVENMTVPEFVRPTPDSQTVFEVYVGSSLRIPLAAKPSTQSVPTTVIESFQVITVPGHQFDRQLPIDRNSPYHNAQRNVSSVLEWKPSDKDIGFFPFQIIVVDSEGFESERTFAIRVKDFSQQYRPPRTNLRNPYFLCVPMPAAITCQLNSTCSFPIYAAPGTIGHFLKSIIVVSHPTTLSNVHVEHLVNGSAMCQGHQVDHLALGAALFQGDVFFTAEMAGNKTMCFKAVDNENLTSEICIYVAVLHPNPCDAMLCASSSTCVPRGESYECVCPPRKTGIHCDSDLNPCMTGACSPGTCVWRSPMSHHMCLCNASEGYAASPDFQSCIDIDDCASNPCLNGGSCRDKLLGFDCLCVNGYTGHTCNTSSVVTPRCSTTTTTTTTTTCTTSNGVFRYQCPTNTNTYNPNCDPVSAVSFTTTGQRFDPNKPQFVQPTPHNIELLCEVGKACSIPIYLTGDNPVIRSFVDDPNLHVNRSALLPAPAGISLPGTKTTNVIVVPHSLGYYTVCVEIFADLASPRSDTICYSVTAVAPSSGSCPPFQCTLDCGLGGYRVDANGCLQCICD